MVKNIGSRTTTANGSTLRRSSVDKQSAWHRHAEQKAAEHRVDAHGIHDEGRTGRTGTGVMPSTVLLISPAFSTARPSGASSRLPNSSMKAA